MLNESICSFHPPPKGRGFPERRVKKGDPTGKIVAWACAICGKVLPKDLAETCCAKKFCDCGEEIKGRTAWLACDSCRNRKDQERLDAKKAKAEKIPVKDHKGGMVYWEEDSNFYDDLESATDECEEEEDQYVQTYWECDSYHLILDAHDIVESALERQEHHEGAWDSVNGVDELKKFLDEWNDTYGKKVTTWVADEKRLIVLDDSKEEK